MAFGKKLDALIKHRGTNVNRVSKQTGIKTQTLYMMIKRDSKSTDMQTMQMLADALMVDVSYFYDDLCEIAEKNDFTCECIFALNFDKAESVVKELVSRKDLNEEQKKSLNYLLVQAKETKRLELENVKLQQRINNYKDCIQEIQNHCLKANQHFEI